MQEPSGQNLSLLVTVNGGLTQHRKYLLMIKATHISPLEKKTRISTARETQ